MKKFYEQTTKGDTLKFRILILSIFTFISNLFPQNISFSFSNQMKAGRGFETGGFYLDKNKKNYLENISDFRIFVPYTTVGYRLEYSKPPEFGLNYVGIRDFFVEFEKDKFNARAGYIQELFSRGLSLHLFRKRELAFDTGIKGIKLSYENEFLYARLIGGNLNFVEPTSIFINNPKTEKYQLKALSIEVKPLSSLSVGFNFTNANGFIPSPITNQDTIEANIPEFFLKTKVLDFDLFFSYAIKNTLPKNNPRAKGTGLYSSVSYGGENFGFTLEYKDYRFDVVDPIRRADAYRLTKVLPFQNPPIVHKEHSFTLLQRYPHIVDFNDEVGLQIDAFFSLSNNTTLNTNISIASRHFDYEKSINPFELSQKKLGVDWLPSLNRKRSPIWEFYFDVEHFYNNADSYVRFGFNRRSKIMYDNLGFYLSDLSLRSVTIPAEIQHRWNDFLVTKFSSESQWVFEYSEDKKYYNHLIGFSATLFSAMTIGFRYEKTTSKYEPEGRRDWFVFEGGYRFSTANSIIMSYGRERGGKVCTQGICREILPYEGLRLILNINLQRRLL